MTAAPSFAVTMPSPSFKTFFLTFKSPVISMTGFNESNLTKMLRTESDWILGCLLVDSSAKASEVIRIMEWHLLID